MDPPKENQPFATGRSWELFPSSFCILAMRWGGHVHEHKCVITQKTYAFTRAKTLLRKVSWKMTHSFFMACVALQKCTCPFLLAQYFRSLVSRVSQIAVESLCQVVAKGKCRGRCNTSWASHFGQSMGHLCFCNLRFFFLPGRRNILWSSKGNEKNCRNKVPNAVHSTLYTWHSPLHTPHSNTLHHYISRFPLYTSQSTFYTRHFILHIPRSTLHTPHSTP